MPPVFSILNWIALVGWSFDMAFKLVSFYYWHARKDDGGSLQLLLPETNSLWYCSKEYASWTWASLFKELPGN
jgi:hypothetical protein